MQLNLDKLAFMIITMALMLLWMPAFLFFPWQIGCGVMVAILSLVFLWGKQTKHLKPQKNLRQSLFYFAIGIGVFTYFQSQAFNLYGVANAVKVETIRTEIRVDEILHQQDYQTLIVSNEKGQRIYLQWRLQEKPKLGEIWSAELRIRPLSSRLNQGGFDRQQWYFSKGITATATTKSAVKIRDDFSWREKRLNQALTDTQNLPQQGLLLALGFGERAWLLPETWQHYQQTNTAHLIAISGLHIGLAMLLGFGIARGVQLLFPTHNITPIFPLIAGVVLAIIYAELAGFAIPTFRAALALLLVLLVKIGRRYYTPWQLFLRVIALLLLCDPMMILSAGFWLSVGAVASLILWYQVFPLRLILWKGKPLPAKVRWIFGLIHLQLGLFWLFTPIQLMIFAGFSFNGFVANLIAVPFYSFFLVPVTLFAALTGGILYSWQLSHFLAEQITRVVAWFEDGWQTVSLQTSLIVTAILALLFIRLMNKIYVPKNTKNKGSIINSEVVHSFPSLWRQRISFLGGWLAFFCLMTVGVQKITEPHWRVETLDIGQGLATLIVKNHHAWLYDTGASWAGGSMAKTEILPYLQRQGLELDGVILSHDDNDHSGGAKDILAAYPQAYLLNASAQNYGKTDRTLCLAGRQWRWQGLAFDVLSPTENVARADNPHSCVVLVTDGRFKVLLTGDADSATEQRILAALPQIDVLQVGHHGSKTSTGAAFVHHIQPKIALISSGRWNPWHFPNKDVVARLEAVGSAVKNTAVLGQISVEFDKNAMRLQSARSDFSPWYRGFIGERSK